MKRLSLNVDPHTHKQIKLAAAQHNETITMFVMRAVKEHLATCHLHRKDVNVGPKKEQVDDILEQYF